MEDLKRGDIVKVKVLPEYDTADLWIGKKVRITSIIDNKIYYANGYWFDRDQLELCEILKPITQHSREEIF